MDSPDEINGEKVREVFFAHSIALRLHQHAVSHGIRKPRRYLRGALRVGPAAAAPRRNEISLSSWSNKSSVVYVCIRSSWMKAEPNFLTLQC